MPVTVFRIRWTITNQSDRFERGHLFQHSQEMLLPGVSVTRIVSGFVTVAYQHFGFVLALEVAPWDFVPLNLVQQCFTRSQGRNPFVAFASAVASGPVAGDEDSESVSFRYGVCGRFGFNHGLPFWWWFYGESDRGRV